MMSAIKLLKVNELKDGTIRLQSQLMVGRDAADFIMQDNVLKNWTFGKNGIGFYEYKGPYKIVTDKSEMSKQEL